MKEQVSDGGLTAPQGAQRTVARAEPASCDLCERRPGAVASLSSWVATLPQRNGGRGVLIALAAVLALGFGLRAYNALNPNVSAGKDSIVAYQGQDEQSYTKIVKALYEHGHYGTPDMASPTDWSPGAPLVWAGVYYITGGVHPQAARMVGAVIGTLVVLLVFLLGRRLGGPIVGLIAAVLTATYPVFLYYAGHFVTEPIGAFWLVAAVLAYLWAADDGRPLWCWLVPGALLGLTTLTRPEYQPFAALLALYALVRVAGQRDIKLGIVAAAGFVAAFALALAPWTIRNYLVLDRFVPVTTGGGKALFVATYYPGDGRQLPVKRALIARFSGREVSQVTDQEVGNTQMVDLLNRVARTYPNLDRDAALSRVGRENFRKYFGGDPVGYSKMVATKMWHVWRRSSSPTMRSTGWIAYHYVLLALALVGMVVLAFRRRWEALVIGTLIVGITVLGGLLLGVPRRNVPLMGLVMVLAAVGVSYLWTIARAWTVKLRTRGVHRVHESGRESVH